MKKNLCAALLLLLAPISWAETRPNVLFIAIDDLKPALGCYGLSQIHSPHIDRLASEGMRFDRAYCQVAVCGATRTSLLTGLRPDATGVYANTINFRDRMPEVVTLPQHFKDHGYWVEGMGKIFHHRDDASWSEPMSQPETPHLTWHEPESQRIIEERRAAFKEKVAELKAAGKAVPSGLSRSMTRGPVVEAGNVPDSAYFDGELCDMAIAALRRVAGKEQPFFLAVGFLKPHLPFVAPKKYWDLYSPADLRMADNPFAPKDAPKAAMHSWEEMRTYAGVPRNGPVSEELARDLVHGYYACVSYTDALVGRLLNELDRLGRRKDTVVILWGDHGWHLGDHGLWCKHSNFESATHVPMILRAPAMPKTGVSTEALVEFVDIYPTVAELAGLPVPDTIAGRSMVPLLSEPGREWKECALSQYPRGDLMGLSMRTERYRLTRWVKQSSRDICAAVELYDHWADPGENVNLAADPGRAELLRRLVAQSEKAWGSGGER